MLQLTNLPQGEAPSQDFQIKLNGICAQANICRVSAMPFNCIWPGHQRPMDQTELASFLNFSADEPVEVELTACKDFEEAVIRPLSAGIAPACNGRALKFTLSHPGQYIVELDGWHNALHIFFNPIDSFQVDLNDPNVIYFPAGVHHPGLITLKSNQTLYLHPDAVVYGSVLAIQAENVRILGYGILDGSWETRTGNTVLVPCDLRRRNPENDVYSPIRRKSPCDPPQDPPVGSVILHNPEQFLEFMEQWEQLSACIHLYQCKNTEINGVVLRDSSGFTVIGANCENLICDNLKLIGMWRYNSDGIDLFNSRNCIIRNCFLRNFDDCVVLKGIVGWDTWNMENILVEKCVVWCDWGRSLEIGAETNAPEYRNIIFRDCDCIHGSSVMLDIQACDWAIIHNVRYENIRAEYSKYDLSPVYQASDDMRFEPSRGYPALIWAGIAGGRFSNMPYKGQIFDVTYKDIQVLTDDPHSPVGICLLGKDAEHGVQNITLENLTINGIRQTDFEPLIHKNEFVSQITVK